MSTFFCSHCSSKIAISNDTYVIYHPSFKYPNDISAVPQNTIDESMCDLSFYRCPNCGNYTIRITGTGEKVNRFDTQVFPVSIAKQFPEYIPIAIREDYEESCAIVNLSPKSSATLSRRCLQGMIRDFWGITKSRLIDEINSLQDKIPSAQWRVIDGVRKIGNIGAHMENDINVIVDIEPMEAEKLIQLIELLINQWYINRHDQEQLYKDIVEIDISKQNNRKNKG